MPAPLSCREVSLGTQRRRLEAGDFVVTESEYAAGLETVAHVHTSTNLVFGLGGSLVQQHGSRTEELGPRSLLVLPREVVHSDRVGPAGCSCLFVTLRQSHLDEVARCSPVLGDPRITSGGHLALLGASLHRESRSSDSARALAIEGLVFGLLADLIRRREPRAERSAPWLEQLRDRLADEFASPPTVAQLAAEVGVDPAYLVRAFSRRYGETIGGFVRRQRFEWAMHALMDSDEPVARIAIAAGFFDQSHFTRHFRRHFGTTPAVFRRDARMRRLP